MKLIEMDGHIGFRLPQSKVRVTRTMSVQQAIVFFHNAYHRFQHAAASLGVIERHFNIADQTICLRFAGDALLTRMTAAFEHLSIKKPKSTDLTICIIDSASTKIPLVFPAWAWQSQYFQTRGEVIPFDNERITTMHNHHTGVLTVVDQKKILLYFGQNLLTYYLGG